ncbi:NAD(P)/FAD-dependent oxidoreductase [Comamonas odontotermitis]|uniref:NAD(P)/FAD-dependent oxidoreductase n=1 Tax=Comamonas odontotermitis TaxID=379895 RepID=UPI003750C352
MQELPIVIVGGGAIGSAIAYFLTLQKPGLPVLVIERDPSYAQASSALSASSIRQQFSTAINIALSQFGIGFLRNLKTELAVGSDQPDIGLVEDGYLYLATQAGEAVLRDNHALQRAHDVDVALLDPEALKARFPWLNVDDIVLGSLGLSAEGWFDGYLLMQSLKAKAVSQGVKYLRAEAVGVAHSRHDGVAHVEAVLLADGTRIACRAMVNAAGAWAKPVAGWLDIDLPVHGKRRTVFNLSSPAKLPRCPLLIDPSGIWLRPEGHGFIAGFCPEEGDDGNDIPLDVEHDAFENFLWPTLAERIPGFEALRVESAWAGYYEMNLFDHNAIIGLHPSCDNAYFANGFSGHGLQQSPAAGRAIAELVLTGRYQTLDVSPLGWERLLRNEPLLEKCII